MNIYFKKCVHKKKKIQEITKISEINGDRGGRDDHGGGDGDDGGMAQHTPLQKILMLRGGEEREGRSTFDRRA